MKLTFDVPEEMAEKIGEEIKAALDAYKKKQIWPRNNDTYYFVSGCGEIDGTSFTATAFDKGCLSYGNMFKTKEEAWFRREQLKVMHELEQLADDDQPFDKDGNYSHVCIQYDWRYNKCRPMPNFRYATYSPFHFKSVESCEAAIDKIGEDRLKKYYFCIPEKKDQQLQEVENYASTCRY